MRDAGGCAARRLPEREFPALLVIWAYQQNRLIFWKRAFFLSRVSANFLFGVFSPFGGVFVLLGGVFALLGGVFVLLLLLFVFRASARIFGGS